MGMIRFSHTIFALPFALLAAILAWREVGEFRLLDLLGILLCMVFARSAAMAFNRLVDRKQDAKNPRTAGRHIPAGLLSVKTVWLFTIVCSVGFIASTLLFLPNVWPVALSIPVLLFLLGYSFTKRFTFLCHYWLAAGLMLSPIAAWLAITGSVNWTPVMLGLSVFFWVGGFDILYACQDAAFDRDSALSSIPAYFGITTALRIAAVSHFCMMLTLLGFWHFAELGYLFLGGIVVIAMLLLYEHLLVKPNDLSRVNVAFFNINAIISLGLLILAVVDVYL
ncbi:4-hydroxybenzoate octaprenyltransferase [Polystyrenella longa]|uniref:4-hydroxybenzoate polyprenyltransferase n=2 Tax=Polystyrenella longa TaxID=2528007 RepID=A0A518CQT6_9PLAN|nr:4-hydroxybenzoate octaprenyltransferase [Polystyrenella longa]